MSWQTVLLSACVAGTERGLKGEKYSRGRSARGKEGDPPPFSRARASRLRIITPFSSPFGAYSAGYASQDYTHPDDHTLSTYIFHIRLLFTPENKNWMVSNRNFVGNQINSVKHYLTSFSTVVKRVRHGIWTVLKGNVEAVWLSPHGLV